MIRIIGIGSPFGDDAAGLEVARRMEAAPPHGCEVVAADRPGAALIDLFDGAGAVILIDAVRSGSSPGTIHDLDLDDIDCLGAALVSSHDFGVAAAVALAMKLGRAPAHGRVLGIEASPGGGAGLDAISPPVSAAIEPAIARARLWATRLSASFGSGAAAPRRSRSRLARRQGPDDTDGLD
jgi:hydrogenase maturation protease